MGIEKVHWEAYKTCNLKCKFCFATFTKTHLDTDEAKTLIKKLADSGTRFICFTSGDPFQREDLVELVGYAKDQGLSTGIDSNGVLATETKLSQLEGILDRLSIPVDGSKKTQDAIRGEEGDYDHIFSLMAYLRGSQIALKVNTIATKVNIGEVLEVGERLRAYPVRQWSVHQFTPVNRGKTYQKLFDIEDEQFERLEREIGRRAYPFSVSLNWKKREDEAFFMISPQGIAYTVIEGQNHYFGNLVTEPVEEVWKRHPKLQTGTVAAYSKRLPLAMEKVCA